MMNWIKKDWDSELAYLTHKKMLCCPIQVIRFTEGNNDNNRSWFSHLAEIQSISADDLKDLCNIFSAQYPKLQRWFEDELWVALKTKELYG